RECASSKATDQMVRPQMRPARRPSRCPFEPSASIRPPARTAVSKKGSTTRWRPNAFMMIIVAIGPPPSPPKSSGYGAPRSPRSPHFLQGGVLVPFSASTVFGVFVKIFVPPQHPLDAVLQLFLFFSKFVVLRRSPAACSQAEPCFGVYVALVFVGTAVDR